MIHVTDAVPMISISSKKVGFSTVNAINALTSGSNDLEIMEMPTLRIPRVFAVFKT